MKSLLLKWHGTWRPLCLHVCNSDGSVLIMRSREGASSGEIPGDSWREEPIMTTSMWRFRKKKKNRRQRGWSLLIYPPLSLSLSHTLTLSYSGQQAAQLFIPICYAVEIRGTTNMHTTEGIWYPPSPSVGFRLLTRSVAADWRMASDLCGLVLARQVKLFSLLLATVFQKWLSFPLQAVFHIPPAWNLANKHVLHDITHTHTDTRAHARVNGSCTGPGLESPWEFPFQPSGLSACLYSKIPLFASQLHFFILTPILPEGKEENT